MVHLLFMQNIEHACVKSARPARTISIESSAHFFEGVTGFDTSRFPQLSFHPMLQARLIFVLFACVAGAVLQFLPASAQESQRYRVIDANLPYEADRLAYRLKQVDTDGTAHFSETITIERGVERVRLEPPFPNPAGGRVTVRYALPEIQEVSLRLYDVLGRQVRTVAQTEVEGREELQVDLSGLPSGTYFLRLRADGTTVTRRLTVVR